MPREPKDFRRISSVRDTQKVFVIASEGLKTEIRYFEELKALAYEHDKELHIEVLKKLNTDSSPEVVIKQLVSFKSEFRLKDGDELWMVIDRDKQSWKPQTIADIARLCFQKRFGFALSNPCFELWLLLHRKDISDYSEEEKFELLDNRKTGKRTKLEQELVRVCGSYSKRYLKTEDYLPFIGTALSRAEALVQNPTERWPEQLGTHVYKLVKKLFKDNDDKTDEQTA